MSSKIRTNGRNKEDHGTQRGATTVEYAVIVVLIILAVLVIVLFLVDPTDKNSLLPSTYTNMGNRIGNFGSANIPTN